MIRRKDIEEGDMETPQHGNGSKIIFEAFPFFLEIQGNPSKVQNC